MPSLAVLYPIGRCDFFACVFGVNVPRLLHPRLASLSFFPLLIEDDDAMTCEPCRALLGKSTDLEPHTALLIRDMRLEERGQVETYRCRDCSTRWHRLKTNLVFRGEPQVWKVLPDSVLKHGGKASHAPV